MATSTLAEISRFADVLRANGISASITGGQTERDRPAALILWRSYVAVDEARVVGLSGA